MRVSNWNPHKADVQIMNASMERLEACGEVVARKARSLVPVGKSRPQYRNGKEWTEREAGALKRSIRVVKLNNSQKRNIRVYAGSRKVYYARFVEMGTSKMAAKPYLRPAFNSSKAEMKQILLYGA